MPTVNLTAFSGFVKQSFNAGWDDVAVVWPDSFNGDSADQTTPISSTIFAGMFGVSGLAVDDGVTVPAEALISDVRMVFDYDLEAEELAGSGLEAGFPPDHDFPEPGGTGTFELSLGALTRVQLYGQGVGWTLQGRFSGGSGTARLRIIISDFHLEVDYTTVAAPTITDVDPDEGTIGTAITITGTGFVSGAVVTFDGYVAPDTVFVGATSITCVAPAGPGIGLATVRVTNPDTQRAQYVGFTYEATAPPGTLTNPDWRYETGLDIQQGSQDQPGSCIFETYEEIPAGTPVVFEPTTGPDEVFRGVAVRVRTEFDEQPSQLRYVVTTQDNSFLLNRRHPFAQYEDTPTDEIVIDLITRFTSGFTTANVEPGLPEVTIGFFYERNVGACLTALANLVNGKWYIGDDDDIHFFQTESLDPPDDLDDASTTLSRDPQISHETDLTQIRNRIHVKGAGRSTGIGIGSPIQSPALQLATATLVTGGGDMPAGGSIGLYRMTYLTEDGETELGPSGPANAGSITASGDSVDFTNLDATVSLDIRVTGRRLYRARFAENNFNRMFLVTEFGNVTGVEDEFTDTLADEDLGDPAPGSNTTSTIFATVNDEEAQAELALIEGGDGVHEWYIEDTTLVTVEECQARGNAELALFARPIETIVYSTRDEKTRVGKTVIANLTDPPIVGSFRIVNVAVLQVDEARGEELIGPLYRVTASSVKYTLEDFLRQLGLGGGGSSVGGGSGSGSGGSAPGDGSVPHGNHTGDVTSVGLVTTIAPNAVTTTKIIDNAVTTAKIIDDAVTNAKLANMTGPAFKGRITGTGDPADLTATEATALLDVMVGDSGSGGTKGLVPAPGAGDAAAGAFLKADGTFAVPGGSGGTPHPLLDGDQNEDTEAAAPQAGDVVYAEAADIGGLDKVFFDGGLVPAMPVGDTGGFKFWFGGGPGSVMFGSASVVKWVRKPLLELLPGADDADKGASVYRSTNFTLADTTPTAVVFDTEVFDDNVFWSVGSPTRFTIAQAGTYMLVGQAEWGTFVGVAYLRIFKNGVKIAEASAPGTAGLIGSIQVSKQDRAIATDYYELYVYQGANTPGTTATIIGGAASTLFQLMRM